MPRGTRSRNQIGRHRNSNDGLVHGKTFRWASGNQPCPSIGRREAPSGSIVATASRRGSEADPRGLERIARGGAREVGEQSPGRVGGGTRGRDVGGIFV